MIFDNLKNKELYFGVNDKFPKAFKFIEKAVAENFSVGKYEIDGDELYAMVQEYDTKLPESGKFEGHKKYIDIQFVVSGIEAVQIVDIERLNPVTEYDSEKDYTLFEDCKISNNCVLRAGEYCIFFANDLHKPGLAFDKPQAVRKIVVKVKI